ncbi:TetR/AcrR family transcriptional regulator [Rhodobacteraceae bacterium KMM 6894]|nr:TetR/AcrR family transcriptional regulator [Rhodobacteraceae bacterium KMM 6894]
MLEQPKRGRPRGYDVTDALEAATCVFWANGYDGAPIDVLCRAMNMPRASLYQRFGDKQRLFLAVVDYYAKTRLEPLAHSLGPSGPLKDDLEAFFGQVVALATHDPSTPGCLISSVLCDAAGTNPLFKAELDRRYTSLENGLAERLRQSDEVLGAPAEVLAVVLASVARGLTLRARSGAPADELRAVGRAAARAFH